MNSYPPSNAVPSSSVCNNPGGRDADGPSRSPTPPAGWRNDQRSAKSSSQAPKSSRRRAAASATRVGEEASLASSASGEGESSLARLFQKAAQEGACQSICVLDTNTLLSALDFVSALYSRLLSLSIDAAAYAAGPPPFVILLPRGVMDELDSLKSHTRKERTAQAARNANRWIVKALQDQRRGWTDAMQLQDVQLARERWPLQLQNGLQEEEIGAHLCSNTDDAIIKTCQELQRRIGISVMLCSNDYNMRARAEGDDVRTFDLDSILQLGLKKGQRSLHAPGSSSGTSGIDGPHDSTVSMVNLLLDQWSVQLEPATSIAPRAPESRISRRQESHRQNVEDAPDEYVDEMAIDMEIDSIDTLPAACTAKAHTSAGQVALVPNHSEPTQPDNNPHIDFESAWVPVKKSKTSHSAQPSRERTSTGPLMKCKSTASSTRVTASAGGADLNPHIDFASIASGTTVSSSASRRSAPYPGAVLSSSRPAASAATTTRSSRVLPAHSSTSTSDLHGGTVGPCRKTRRLNSGAGRRTGDSVWASASKPF